MFSSRADSRSALNRILTDSRRLRQNRPLKDNNLNQTCSVILRQERGATAAAARQLYNYCAACNANLGQRNAAAREPRPGSMPRAPRRPHVSPVILPPVTPPRRTDHALDRAVRPRWRSTRLTDLTHVQIPQVS
ncbi:hypothetical protein ACJJTC_014640 [Scirpophaga incertulas]